MTSLRKILDRLARRRADRRLRIRSTGRVSDGVSRIREQTAPGMTQWESLKYKTSPTSNFTPRKGPEARTSPENMAIYYAASATPCW